MSQITQVQPAQPSIETQEQPEKARTIESARQFEALLIAQMMKSMREAGSGSWLGSGEDKTAESAMALAEEQFAQALAAQGGLGLASLIVQGLEAEDQAQSGSGSNPAGIS
ncbi:MAG: hypothetical protein ACRD7E_00905 [Bryobacteraceae bacterium]